MPLGTKRSNHELYEMSLSVSPGAAKHPRHDSPLTRFRRRAVPASNEMRKGLTEVVKQRFESTSRGDEPVRQLSQVCLFGERNKPLKRRFLSLAAIVASFWAFVVRRSMYAQLQRWEEHRHDPDTVIGLTGIDGCYVVPFIFSFWYLVLCFALVRLMTSFKPAAYGVFEVMVVYNIIQAMISAFIGAAMMYQVWELGLKIVGNPIGGNSSQDLHVAFIAVLHYHRCILELCDTFFLIVRKKTGGRSSLNLHVMQRLQTVWGWHVACRFGCGGDIFFPVVVTALCSAVLHMHYILTSVEPHASQVPAAFRWLLLGEQASRRRVAVMTLQVWCFRACLIYGLLSFYAGAYPRAVSAATMVQCAFGSALYSDFNYRKDKKNDAAGDEETTQEEHPAKLAFSFDSSGWCYMYHFGVAMWIQEHFDEEITNGELAFSGSSGGAIVGCALAGRLDIPLVLDDVLKDTWDVAHLKPWKLPQQVWKTLEKFVPEDGHVLATNRLRVLCTRMLSKPPFLHGEVFSEFPTREYLFKCLMASSHIPVLFGCGYKHDGGRYFDGAFWPSAFIPWRSFPSQSVCRVSCFSHLGSDIGPRWFAVPPIWWAVYPPNHEVLEGLMWAGYRDIASVFGSVDGRPRDCTCSRREKNMVDRKENLSTLPMASSKKADELILIYERAARRAWAGFFGFFLAVTIASYLTWLGPLMFS